ncbi:GNAT family N-acetyltransferase [Ewingella americana]|uniref:GNAT family N-acetyltransferase n=1 Tax=Ewingella americana TaxID=41202 RepID=UPI0012ADFBF5|nr:GNAT family N-acetyltransferase [Ewingella americana]MRT05036.1 GNAT family N-acetyltransferase [Ewingella americana]
MEIIKSGHADAQAILQILSESKGENLTPEQRASEGFTQGNMDESLLKTFQDGVGVFICKEQGEIAGVAMTSLGKQAKQGVAQATYNAVVSNGKVPAEQIFLYGPVSVRWEFRGKGILTQLLVHICETLQHRFALGVAFVDKENQKSLAIHRHYPMTEFDTISLNRREYVIFTFEPSRVLAFYKKG